MKTAALIPCRTGSKGIPNKNFTEFNGEPLWKWTLDSAIKSGIFDNILLSSNGGLNGYGSCLCQPSILLDNERPEEYSTDEANLDTLLCYYAEKCKDIEMWCLLQPTSPLRTAGDIKKAYRMACRDKFDSVVSVTWNPMMFWIEKAVGIKEKDHCIATYHISKRPNRQQRDDFYMENGAIYFTKKYVLDSTGVRLGGTIGLYKMPKERSFEIDDMDDWKIAEFVAKGGLK